MAETKIESCGGRKSVSICKGGPFNDGNGQMSRFLTTSLLYHSGYFLGKCISLESKITRNKALYSDALKTCREG